MNLNSISKKVFLATSLVLAFSSAASACWTNDECAAATRKKEEGVVTRSLPDVKSSISGFYRTLGLKNDAAAKGLTIAWYSSTSAAHGAAIATGKSSGGCPEFEVIALHSNRLTYKYQSNIFFCPR